MKVLREVFESAIQSREALTGAVRQRMLIRELAQAHEEPAGIIVLGDHPRDRMSLELRTEFRLQPFFVENRDLSTAYC